jgi:hypothetical protein
VPSLPVTAKEMADNNIWFEEKVTENWRKLHNEKLRNI